MSCVFVLFHPACNKGKTRSSCLKDFLFCTPLNSLDVAENLTITKSWDRVWSAGCDLKLQF